MNNRRLFVAGACACVTAVPVMTTLANGASDPGSPVVPPAVASQLSDSQAAQIVGPSARTFPGANGVTRVEGNGQVCSVAPDRILACGPNKGLDQAPVVDVTIADGGKLAVSFLTSNDVSNIDVTDAQGGRQSVGLAAGIGRTSIPQGNFKFAWKTADGKTHNDAVPAQKMFPPANAPSVNAR